VGKRDIPLADKLAYYLLKSVNKAVRDYRMLDTGDRVAVAVSGGKDSLTLLKLLQVRRQTCGQSYEIVAIHVTGREEGPPYSGAVQRQQLEGYLQSTGQEYVIEQADPESPQDCFRCSYLRRKAILQTAWRLRCNKVALGHHSDDAAETTLLNLLFQGKIETLSPCRSYADGKLLLVRPLFYVPEKEITRFARASNFPVMEPTCSLCHTSQRQRIKGLLRSLEKDYPRIRINLLRAGLMENAHDDERAGGTAGARRRRPSHTDTVKTTEEI
jgi:tRNA 2-thiocytidine biosynthesis protein TtcA